MSYAIVLPTHRGFKDHTGREFGKLTVISFAGFLSSGRGRAAAWLCRCKCGNEKVIRANDFQNKTNSCGCGRKEAQLIAVKKHGLSESSEYIVWGGMKGRCADKKQKSHGGRGIKVCERWMTFENFLADMGPRPSDQHQIDRINNNGNYEPGNCRWATRSEQMRNTRGNRVLEFRGEVRTVAEWVVITGIPCRTLRGRLWLGWPIEKALTTPVKKRSKH